MAGELVGKCWKVRWNLGKAKGWRNPCWSWWRKLHRFHWKSKRALANSLVRLWYLPRDFPTGKVQQSILLQILMILSFIFHIISFQSSVYHQCYEERLDMIISCLSNIEVAVRGKQHTHFHWSGSWSYGLHSIFLTASMLALACLGLPYLCFLAETS